jgi:hypothetical protein
MLCLPAYFCTSRIYNSLFNYPFWRLTSKPVPEPISRCREASPQSFCSRSPSNVPNSPKEAWSAPPTLRHIEQPVESGYLGVFNSQERWAVYYACIYVTNEDYLGTQLRIGPGCQSNTWSECASIQSPDEESSARWLLGSPLL